eukprot:CAMPEP_0116835138 /NCGR_PEP_ID=MMETSP0418-20121206/7381_1 /TAXON_ID=1158023 /ORGANISM="Astrosyne radiata, Strain 13vi08-1A" /LENGTH=330 /DNA_ID=CAMNT_0004464777 /DNA_START=281 /DNA_END=1273 /DNA_ORIENTATION=+
MGPEVFELEKRLAEYVNVRHCIATASGTSALMLALMALGIRPQDEVITTPFSFAATVEAIALVGAVPVLVDIERATYNMDPSLIERAITVKTKAIMPVSLYGQCADFTCINALAESYGLPVIEDGAQSFGATHHKKYSCALSTIGCTSFYPSKPLGCYGDGGGCFTNDDQLAENMRMLRVHGQSHRYHHVMLGMNARLDTMQAAVLLAKMDIFPHEVVRRATVAQKYTEQLKNKFKVPYIQPENTSVFAQYTIKVECRETLRTAMYKNGIPTAVHYPIPLHLQPAFKEFGYRKGDFPVAEDAACKVMSLPMDSYVNDDEIAQIVAALNHA